MPPRRLDGGPAESLPAEPSRRGEQSTRRGSPLTLAGATLAVLCLASCEPSRPHSGPPSPGPGLFPAATLVPIPSTATPRPIGGTEPALAISPLVREDFDLFDEVELEVRTDIVPDNPFDPAELDIRVEFTAASGATAEVGAFWYQDYDARGLSPVGDPGWRVRFTPTETGEWTAVARIPARGAQSDPVTFRVLPSDDPGFVRIHPENPRYLAFDSDEFFFPIGLNMAWWTATGDALTDYGRWIDPFAANGGNTIRVWMAEWSFGLEWGNTPLGDYRNRLWRAWALDRVFEMAEERQVYLILVLLNCADFNDWQTNGWAGNPYNATRGGPLESPEQFVTDPTARALFQRRLDYIIRRWGYSTQLLAWEWWNEVNLAPFSDATLVPWLQEMTAFLRERDVNRHLTTNSYAIRDLSPVWAMPELDIIQKHEYAHQVQTTERDIAGRVAADLTRLADSAPPKPILLGEFGYGTEGTGNDIDRSGIHLHNGIWATTFAGYAGSGLYWFWDVYVEAYRAWHHFGGLSAFLQGVDLSRYEPFSPLELSGPGGSPPAAVGLGLRGDDVRIWLRSDAYTVQAAEDAWRAAGTPGAFYYNPPRAEGLVVTLRGMADGVYLIRWFDPQGGHWLAQDERTASGGSLSIPVPSFRQDLAATIAGEP